MQLKHAICGAILVLIGLLLIGCTQKEIKFVCSDGMTVSDASYCTSYLMNQASFESFWRGTGVVQQYEVGKFQSEVSYTFISNNVSFWNRNGFNHTCQVFVDNNPNPGVFWSDVGVQDNAYAGLADINQDHVVSACCSNICKESILHKRPSSQ